MKWGQLEQREKNVAIRCAKQGALFFGSLMALLTWLAGVELERGWPLVVALLLVLLGLCMGFCFGAVVGLEYIRLLRKQKGGPDCE